MALIGINPVGNEPQKESGLDKVLKGVQIAQGLMGTGLAIPKFLQERSEFRQMQDLRGAQATKYRAEATQIGMDNDPVPKEQLDYFTKIGVPEAALPRTVGQARGLAEKMIETPAQALSRQRADAQLEQIGITNRLLMSKEQREGAKYEREMDLPNLSPAEKKIDEKVADELADWTLGARANAYGELENLGKALENMKDKPGISGKHFAFLPDRMLPLTHPDAAITREAVQAVVQKSLRQILGAQFTEKEGERIMNNAYNIVLPPEENMRRVGILMKQLKSVAKAKDDAAAWLKEHRTMQGYSGILPRDIDSSSIMSDAEFKVKVPNSEQKQQQKKITEKDIDNMTMDELKAAGLI